MIQDIVGYIGGIFIMVSFIPQVLKSHRTKSVKDLSLLMIAATLIGTLFWIAYGFLINARPIIIMNIIFGIIVLMQFHLKVKYEKNKP